MQVSITKHLMFLMTPFEQGLIMRGLSELPAKDSLDLLNRMAMIIAQNEQPAPAESEPTTLKPVSGIAPPHPDANP